MISYTTGMLLLIVTFIKMMGVGAFHKLQSLDFYLFMPNIISVTRSH